MFAKGVFSHFINMRYTEFPGRIKHQLLLRITNLTDVEMPFAIGKTTLKFNLKEFSVVTGFNCATIQTST